LVGVDAAKAMGKLAEAGDRARDAVGAALRGRADDALARAWIARVSNAGDRRDLASAEDLAATAGPVIDRVGAPPRLVAQLLRLRALVAFNRGAFAAATALLVEARGKYPADARTSEIAQLESALGTTARGAGELAAAEAHHRAALAIDRAVRGDRHPDVARDLHNLAGLARLRGELADATTLYREALAIEEAMAHPVEAGLTHNSLGLVAIARADWPTARVELTAALEALTAAGHGDRAFAEHNLGIVAAATGDHRGALAHYARAAAVYATTIGPTAPSAIRLVDDRARSQRALDAATKKAPPPAPPAPLPIPDVGVYGSSQGW
ncbi:MAG: tetratricopeptide repeat protein, partial [Proteobacteria bacterium]|nr:tetratricopeptide repeat protein [Pseudomonadota bacterium]